MRSDQDETRRNAMNRDEANRNENRNDTNRADANRNEGRSALGRTDDDSRHDAKSHGDEDRASRGLHRSEGRFDEGRYGHREGGRHDGGRYDTGRFGGDFYEGGRHDSGMGGRYDTDRFGGYPAGAPGGYGGRGGMESSYGGTYGGPYGGGYQGGWGGYGGDYGRYGGSDYRTGDYGGYYDDRFRGEDRDSGGGRSWIMAAGAAAIAAVGGYALYRSARGTKHDRQGRSRWRGIHVEESVTIQKPASEIYRQWSDVENLGHILSHVEKVEKLPDGRSRWTAKGPANTKVEWDAETVQDIENERITWRSAPGADVPNEGSVWFQERSGGRGTEVHVSLMYHPPGGALAAGLASLFGEEPHQQIADDLRSFKRKLEAGESIGDAHKNPSGRSASSGSA